MSTKIRYIEEPGKSKKICIRDLFEYLIEQKLLPAAEGYRKCHYMENQCLLGMYLNHKAAGLAYCFDDLILGPQQIYGNWDFIAQFLPALRENINPVKKERIIKLKWYFDNAAASYPDDIFQRIDFFQTNVATAYERSIN